MRINIKIEYDKPQLPIHNVAQILNGLALVHYGLNFIDSGNLEDLNAAFFRINREDSINFNYYNHTSIFLSCTAVR